MKIKDFDFIKDGKKFGLAVLDQFLFNLLHLNRKSLKIEIGNYKLNYLTPKALSPWRRWRI